MVFNEPRNFNKISLLNVAEYQSHEAATRLFLFLCRIIGWPFDN